MKQSLRKNNNPSTLSASQPIKKEPTAQKPWWAPDNVPAPAKKAETKAPAAPAMNARVVKEMQRIVKEGK